MHASPPRMIAASLLVTLAVQTSVAQSQKKSPDAAARPVCEVPRALQLVREQLSEAKAFENGAQRAAVMTQAAEALWPFEEAEARAVLSDAFEVASAHYREHGQEYAERKPTRPDATLSGLLYTLPDPRVAVINAVAWRDPAWARKLAARAAEETRERAADGEAKVRRENEAAEKLLSMARAFLEPDVALAVSVAREALRHPPARSLPGFFYELSKFDRATADSFYADALRAYSGADAPTLLTLSAYPFAFNQNIGLQPGSSFVGSPPQGFAPSPALQRQFAAAFLRLAERRLAEAAGQPPPQDEAARPSEVELIYTTLTALESLYGPADKTYAAAAAPLKQTAGALLTERGLRRAESGAHRKLTFDPASDASNNSGLLDRVLENAEQVKDPDRRDQQIVTGLQGALRTESVERLEAAAGKIKDEFARRQLLDMIYFTRALKEVKDGRLDEAARFAEKVDSVEQRAMLTSDVAAAELKLSPDPAGATRAASLAESVYRSAQRAPDSEEKVRALLTLAHVYASTDPLRAPALLSEAVALVNRLPGFDITRTFSSRAIEGRTFSFFAAYPIPSFTVTGELYALAARDFEAALNLSGALDDKYQRARAVVSLASKCLEDAPKPEKPAASAKPAPRQTPAPKKPDAAPKPPAPQKKRP